MSEVPHQGDKQIYGFEDFRLDAAKRLLFDENGIAAPLMPKAFDILLYLVRNAGSLVGKDDLMSAIWPDTVVEENNLTQNISILRRILGEKHGENRFIATVPGRGYKFVAAVTPVNEYPQQVEPHELLLERSDRGRPWFFALSAIVLIGLVAMGFFLITRESPVSTEQLGSIAVLPFRPLTMENRDEPLEFGMADTLIMKLSGGELVVRPLSAVRRFNSIDQDAILAGRALNVDAVLDGNIQVSGDRVRVSVKLLRISDGKQLWANQFDEKLADIFSVQDSISDRVAASLKVTLGQRDKRYTESVEAYQLYMKGNFHASRLIFPEVQKGIAFYQQAIEIDPNYALAFVGIANAYRTLVLTSDASPMEFMPKAKNAAQMAVNLDPALAESWTALGTSNFWYDWDWQTAEEHFVKAIDINPNSAQPRIFYAHFLSNLGRHDDALAEFKRARELDPVNLLIRAVEGQGLYFAGRDDESIQALHEVLAMDKNIWLGHLFLSRPYIRKGMIDPAIAAAQKARELSGGSAEAAATVGYALAISGRTEDALQMQAELVEQSDKRYVPAYTLAQIPNALGRTSEALDLLERSAKNRDALMVFLKVEPKWDNLRNEPRFIELMRRMNFSE